MKKFLFIGILLLQIALCFLLAEYPATASQKDKNACLCDCSAITDCIQLCAYGMVKCMSNCDSAVHNCDTWNFFCHIDYNFCTFDCSKLKVICEL